MNPFYSLEDFEVAVKQIIKDSLSVNTSMSYGEQLIELRLDGDKFSNDIINTPSLRY